MALPCTFHIGYGSAFPAGSISNIVTALAATTQELSIACGTPPEGVLIALLALTKNNYASFLDEDNSLGVGKLTTKTLSQTQPRFSHGQYVCG